MYEVVMVPVDTGVVVYVYDEQAKRRSVAGRVAWSRTSATGWFKIGSFKRSLRRVIARAQQEANALNSPLADRPQPHRIVVKP